MTDSTAPEQIIINGQEYSPEDATLLIELGNKVKKIESDLNTSIDKVYPEYTKSAQERAQLRKELDERNSELEQLRQQKAKEQADAETPTDVKKIREAARQVGLLDEDVLKEKGYMTRSELDAYYEEKETLKKAADTVLKQASTLEEEIDGSDGRQPFNKDAVMAYAYVNGISDLRDAYEKMNDKYNAKWKAQQIDAQERPGLTTLRPGGKKEPQRVRVTNDNLGQMLGEMIDGINE